MKNKEMIFVWSRNIRVYHWLNVLCVFLLVVVGTIILNAKFLGVSVDGKIALKTLHVCIGYVFAVNLLFRLILGVFGKGFERFGQMLPFVPGFLKELKALKNEQQKPSKGHNPAGKLMIAALLLTMSFQMITGLVIAGTDIYYPPFGQHFANEIAIDKSQVDLIKPYSKENVDPEAYKEMRTLRSPFITIHIYAFYLMLFLIPLHIIGVVLAERKHKSSLVSSMISGYKSLPKD